MARARKMKFGKKKENIVRQVRSASMDSVLKAIEEGTTNIIKDYCYHGGFEYNVGRRKEVVPPTVCNKIDPDTLQCIAYAGEHTSPVKKCRPVFDEEGNLKECVLGCAFSPVAYYNSLVRHMESTVGAINPLKASKRAAKARKAGGR
jgi:hypothetical protein